MTYIGGGSLPGIYLRRADGTGTDSLLVAGAFDEGVLSPDGTWLLLRHGALGSVSGGRDITGVRLGVDTVPAPILVTKFDEMAPMLSPDGQWLAYQSDETGKTEVFLRGFPDVGAFKRQVSNGGGEAPLWSRDGRELFYLSGTNDMMAVRVASGPQPTLSEPERLFRVLPELLGVESAFYTPWDVARDGRFIMARLVQTATGTTGVIVVAENWLSELKALLP